MAIAYKSQGSGVATEASGGALSPLCPATVDVGDILIAHTGWEGTSNAPSTPTGWTLLGGPYTIESAHRHWVFGRIAQGNEDAAAVAFGSPAVTTVRTARVYSFSGRELGSITELVPSISFAHLSHATDPQMPTVTTTVTGAMAVACVWQADDNAQASATGESGGDWVEAVGEYVQSATTPDTGMGIQTCIPTANPGTVTGGTISTTDDPCGVIGFEIRPNPRVTAIRRGVGPPHELRLRRPPFPAEHPFYPAPAIPYTVELDGALTPVGGLVNAVSIIKAGPVTPGGLVLNATGKILTGETTPTGDLLANFYALTFIARTQSPGVPHELVRRRLPKRALGEVAAGQEFTLGVSGAVTPTAGLVNAVAKALSASTTPTGSLLKAVANFLAGAFTPTGSLAKGVGKPLAGAVTPSAAVLKTVGKGLSGTETPTGTVTDAVAIVLGGSETPTGNAAKGVGKILAGGITPTGTLTAIRQVVLLLAGAITPFGDLIKAVGKVTSGGFTPTGAIAKAVGKLLAAELQPTGSQSSGAGKGLGGEVTPTGARVSGVGKALSSETTPSGLLVKAVSKILAGGFTPSGFLDAVKSGGTAFFVSVGGTLSSSGALTKAVGKGLAGGFSPTALLLKAVSKFLGGSVTPSGTFTVGGFNLGHFDEPTPASAMLGEPSPTAAHFGQPSPTAALFNEPTPTAGHFDEPTANAGHFDEPTPT